MLSEENKLENLHNENNDVNANWICNIRLDGVVAVNSGYMAPQYMTSTVKMTSDSRFYATSYAHDGNIAVSFLFNADPNFWCGQTYAFNYVWGNSSTDTEKMRPIYYASANSDCKPSVGENLGTYNIPACDSSGANTTAVYAYVSGLYANYVRVGGAIKKVSMTGPYDIRSYFDYKIYDISDNTACSYGEFYYKTSSKTFTLTDSNKTKKYYTVPIDVKFELQYKNNQTDKYIYFTELDEIVPPGVTKTIATDNGITNKEFKTAIEAIDQKVFYVYADNGSSAPKELSSQFTLDKCKTAIGLNTLINTVAVDGKGYKVTAPDYTKSYTKYFDFTNQKQNYYRYGVESKTSGQGNTSYNTTAMSSNSINMTTQGKEFGPALINTYTSAGGSTKALPTYGTLTSVPTNGSSVVVKTNESNNYTAYHPLYKSFSNFSTSNEVYFKYTQTSGDDKAFGCVRNSKSYLYVHPAGFTYSAVDVQVGEKKTVTIGSDHASQSVTGCSTQMVDCNGTVTINFSYIDIDGNSTAGIPMDMTLTLYSGQYSDYSNMVSCSKTISKSTSVTSTSFKVLKNYYYRVVLTVTVGDYFFNDNNTRTYSYELFKSKITADVTKDCKMYYKYKNIAINKYKVDDTEVTKLHASEKIVTTHIIDGVSKETTLTSSNTLPYTIKTDRDSTLSIKMTVDNTTYKTAHLVNSAYDSYGNTGTISKSSEFDVYSYNHYNLLTDVNWMPRLDLPYNVDDLFFTTYSKYIFYNSSGTYEPANNSTNTKSGKCIYFQKKNLEKDFNTTNKIKPANNQFCIMYSCYLSSTTASSNWDNLIDDYNYHIAFSSDDTAWRVNGHGTFYIGKCTNISTGTYQCIPVYTALTGYTNAPSYGYYTGPKWGNLTNNMKDFIQPCVSADATNIENFDITLHDALVVNRTTEGDKIISAGSKGKWYIPKHNVNITVKNTSTRRKIFTITGLSSNADQSATVKPGESYTFTVSTTSNITFTEENAPAYGKIKVSGSWKDASTCYVKVSGVWKEVTAVYTKVNGVWKETS